MYDNAGNILSRSEYGYTKESLEGITPTDTVNYTYGDDDWGDLLTAYDGQTITYDEIGNPLSDGTWTYTWEHGRELASMSDGTTTWNYTYNADGLRTQRTNGTNTYKYIYNGSSLVQMTVGNDTLYFTSDTVTYNNTVYYYVKNIQGDVVAILDTDGEAVVQYTYDAWGNILSMSDTSNVNLGTLNPLRYRGYVYDSETELYYLQSRYYDPEIGRFINADAFASTGQGLLGNNMFAYCGNNPVSRVDPGGLRFSSTIFATCVAPGMGARYDFVIYYFHPDSKQNLDRVAVNNHYVSDTYFYSAGTFEELAQAVNSILEYANDVYIYMHSNENELSFYYAKYFSAKDIANSFNEITIDGNLYLFSCKGGRGDLASAMASATNCTVIACEYKVSFGREAARCGWRNYLEENDEYGDYAWYSVSPDGNKVPYSQYWVYTQ